MSDPGPNVRREIETVGSMIRIHCMGKHGKKRKLCKDCQELLEYATFRLEKCKWGEQKPTCEKCPAHCYKPKMRERIKAVMRYSGPRMLFKHPIKAIRHSLKGKKKVPERKSKKRG